MERDRYQQNHSLFIVGMICLVCCMGLIGFSLYFAPPLIWGLSYHIPQFLWDFQAYLQRDYAWSEKGAAVLIFFLFFILGVIAGIIADFASNRIDNAIYGIKREKKALKAEAIAREDIQQAHSLEMKILFFIVLVVVGALLLQWFFYLTA